LNTQGATDTKLFINDRNLQWLMRAATGIELKNWLLQQCCKGDDASVTARRAAVNGSRL
jgi:hypothetical protein